MQAKLRAVIIVIVTQVKLFAWRLMKSLSFGCLMLDIKCISTYSFNFTAGNSVTSIWFACTTTFSLNWRVTMLKSVKVLNTLYEAPSGIWFVDLIVLCTVV